MAASHDSFALNRNSFPPGFIFGTASASYQYEGAANEGGRTPSIWDTFAHKYPEKITDRSNGDVAQDFYHRYKEDVKLMKKLHTDAFRFSISWSRVLPSGHLSGGVNEEGIQFYNNLIDELLANGQRPFVTLFHWDLPQALEDEYGGFLSSRIVNDFKDFAELCYERFGDRVKDWVTLNEPLSYAQHGYASGVFAPGRCSKFVSPKCTGGDSGTEPYIVAHNQLLAHAAAVDVYRKKYKTFQKGQIGIALNSGWIKPFHQTLNDTKAAYRSIDFSYGWFMHPITYGSYPAEMVKFVKERLPKFSKEQSSMVKGSYDFIGLNYYSSSYAKEVPCQDPQKLNYFTDNCVSTTGERNGVPIGLKTASDWLLVYPPGIQDILLYTKDNYQNPVIYITENGVDEFNNGTIFLEDTMRINYHKDHFSYIHKSINEDKVDVRGYFAWSLLDNYEWNNGYSVRFGIYFVDYKDGLKRIPKKSAKWFKKFLKRENEKKSANRH